MKLLSFQPFSLYTNGGGSRVLRRLYEGRESDVSSLVVKTECSKFLSGNIPETVIEAMPIRDHWMRWQLRDGAQWLREGPLKRFTTRRLHRAAAAMEHDVIHVVNHGGFSTALCDFALESQKPLWVSFHDHFSTCSSFKDTQLLWDLALRRLVISEELGNEYQKLFGKAKYEVISDGVKEDEISDPIGLDQSPIIIYFAGLLHLDYLPLFQILADALDAFSREGYKFKLILRGSYPINFLNTRAFEVEYRTNFISEREIKKELDSASILYLPIKFSDPAFYLYSLSTKMVQYLGATGAILYHGPENSAACNFLRRSNSAICCDSLDVELLIESLKLLLDNKVELSENAKSIAVSHFRLQSIQDQFWGKNKL